MVFKLAEIEKLEKGWRIAVGDGETADFCIFVDNITIVKSPEEAENLDDLLNAEKIEENK